MVIYNPTHVIVHLRHPRMFWKRSTPWMQT